MPVYQRETIHKRIYICLHFLNEYILNHLNNELYFANTHLHYCTLPTPLYTQRRWKIYLFVCSWIHQIDDMSGDRYTLANKNYKTVAPVEYAV